MALRPWLDRNGRKLTDANGVPYLCETCPCGENCSQRLAAREAALRANPAYTFIRKVEVSYTCPSNGSGGAGSLAVLMARNETWASPYRYAVKAVEFEDMATGEHITIACLCSCSGDYSYSELEGYGIAGTVNASASASCTPASICDVYKMEIDYFASWHGGVKYGEGFFDSYDNSNWSYTTFRKAVVYDVSDPGQQGTTKLAWIACGCTSRASAQWKTDIDVHFVAGMCDSPCQDLLVLRERALQNGWTWHDGGYIVRKAYCIDAQHCNVCDFYDVDSRIKCIGCADDGTNWHFVRCGCWDGIETIAKDSLTPWLDPMDEPPEGCTAPSGFTDYIDYPYACGSGSGGSGCSDIRELLLDYPEMFGVEEIAWSSDQKVQVTSTWEDPSDGSIHTTTTVTTMYSLLGYGNDYIDYRTLCVVRKNCCGGWKLCAYNDRNSRWGDECWDYPDYKPEFLGERTTWGVDPDLGGTYNRTGHVVAWWNGCSESFQECFDNQADAESWYQQYGRNPQKPSPCGIRDYAQEAHESVLTPSLELEYVEGGVEEVVHQDEWEDPDGQTHIDTWSEWCVTVDRWCPSGGFSGYYGTAIYYVNWLYTNNGILVNGEEGYQQSITILGIGEYGGNCMGHSGVPEQDETVNAQWYDPSFHWCDPDFVPPEEDEEDVEEV